MFRLPPLIPDSVHFDRIPYTSGRDSVPGFCTRRKYTLSGCGFSSHFCFWRHQFAQGGATGTTGNTTRTQQATAIVRLAAIAGGQCSGKGRLWCETGVGWRCLRLVHGIRSYGTVGLQVQILSGVTFRNTVRKGFFRRSRPSPATFDYCSQKLTCNESPTDSQVRLSEASRAPAVRTARHYRPIGAEKFWRPTVPTIWTSTTSTTPPCSLEIGRFACRKKPALAFDQSPGSAAGRSRRQIGKSLRISSTVSALQLN